MYCAGVGTYALEMLEDRPDLHTILVPIGGGSAAAGACLTARTLNPAIRIIGVQAEASPAAYLSWQRREMVVSAIADASSDTIPYNLPTCSGR